MYQLYRMFIIVYHESHEWTCLLLNYSVRILSSLYNLLDTYALRSPENDKIYNVIFLTSTIATSTVVSSKVLNG